MCDLVSKIKIVVFYLSYLEGAFCFSVIYTFCIFFDKYLTIRFAIGKKPLYLCKNMYIMKEKKSEKGSIRGGKGAFLEENEEKSVVKSEHEVVKGDDYDFFASIKKKQAIKPVKFDTSHLNVGPDDDDEEEDDSEYNESMEEYRRHKEKEAAKIAAEIAKYSTMFEPKGGIGDSDGSFKREKDYKPRLGDAHVAQKVEIGELLRLANDIAEGKSVFTEGKFGMNIAEKDGEIHMTVEDILRQWDVDCSGLTEEQKLVQARYFLIETRNWFLKRYQAMLSCVASLPMYAQFKGVEYKTIAAKVFRTVSYWEKVAKRQASGLSVKEKEGKMELIEISGVKFILISVDEFYDWHKFLAKKGMLEYSDGEEYEKARYLAKVYAHLGGDPRVIVERIEKGSVGMFLQEFQGGIIADNGSRKPEGRGYFFNAERKGLTMDTLYNYYWRWMKDVVGGTPMEYVKFCRRIYEKGFTRFNKEGKRGIYYFLVDPSKENENVLFRGLHKTENRKNNDWRKSVDGYEKIMNEKL